ncbi:MAG: hypothetical protein K8S00_02625 [Bacteroidales bacterium]|nr:hypothetical protein [Bacteroidales bacterium]
MKKNILFTVLIGMMIMFQSLSFGAELTIYGSGGITINPQNGEVTVCPTASTEKCATLIIEPDEIKILDGNAQGNYPGQGINGVITTEDGQSINVQIIQGNISVGSNGEYVLSSFDIKVINP